MKRSLSLLLCCAGFLLAGSGLASAGPVLTGNKGLAGNTLDDDAVKAVLLGKKSTLGDARVVLVIVKGSAAQEAFLSEHLGMTTDQFNTYWRRLFMTGGGSAPKNADSEEDACKLVANTPGAITIVDAAKVGDLPVLAGK